jgi:hypothetical protein
MAWPSLSDLSEDPIDQINAGVINLVEEGVSLR